MKGIINMKGIIKKCCTKGDTVLAFDILNELNKQGFSPNQKKLIKEIFGSSYFTDFTEWLNIIIRNSITPEELFEKHLGDKGFTLNMKKEFLKDVMTMLKNSYDEGVNS